MTMQDISFYRSMLAINKNNLDGELETQGQYQEEIGRQVAKVNSQQLASKDALSKVEAELFADLKDGTKISNDLAQAEVKKDRRRVQAWDEYNTARQDFEEWVALYEAWKGRNYALKTLSDLYGGDYFVVTTTTAPRGEVVVQAARTAVRDASVRRRAST